MYGANIGISSPGPFCIVFTDRLEHNTKFYCVLNPGFDPMIKSCELILNISYKQLIKFTKVNFYICNLYICFIFVTCIVQKYAKVN